VNVLNSRIGNTVSNLQFRTALIHKLVPTVPVFMCYNSKYQQNQPKRNRNDFL